MPPGDFGTIARMHRLELDGRDLAYATWGSGPAEIVMLHDGLGSVRQWRGVPEALHEATGRTVLAYERAGHGSSLPVPEGAWPADWLHREAALLAALLEQVASDPPLLVGHSDGGSIALLTAAAGHPLRGVVALAAHSYVEQVCVDQITAMRADHQRVATSLARAHEHPAAIFEAWSGVWTSAAFRPWDIRPDLGDIACPALVVQGIDDEYGTPEQAWSTTSAIGAIATCVLLPEVGHLIHHQVPERVVELVADFDRSTSDG